MIRNHNIVFEEVPVQFNQDIQFGEINTNELNIDKNRKNIISI